MTTLCTWIQTGLDGLDSKIEDLETALQLDNKEVQAQIICSMKKTVKSMEDFIHRQGGR